MEVFSPFLYSFTVHLGKCLRTAPNLRESPESVAMMADDLSSGHCCPSHCFLSLIVGGFCGQDSLKNLNKDHFIHLHGIIVILSFIRFLC